MRRRNKIIGKFSENFIKRYLDDKVYEKRGWTKKQYIQKCKSAWKKITYDPVYERKIIIDFSEPVTVSQLFGIDNFEVDFVDNALSQQVVNGFEDKNDIECITFCSGKRPGKDGKIERVRIAEAFRPTCQETENETLEKQLYFVALFDVLGFSNLVKEKGSEAILQSYKRLMNMAILDKSYTAFGRIKTGKNNFIMGGSYAPTKYAYFSDTILLWTTSHDTNVSPFISKCSDLICEALKIGMPLRGSICFGEAIMNKSENIYVGEAIVEANEIEKNQKWIGATLGEAFSIRQLTDVLSETLVVPLFCEHFKETMKVSFPYLTLDWVSRWKEKKHPDLLSIIEEFRNNAPEKNKVYYDNTIDFIKFSALDSPQERAVFLRSKGYRIKDATKIDANHLHMRLIILKVLDEIPHAGFIFTFPDEILKSSKELRVLLKDSFLFVKRLDKDRMLNYFADLGKKQLRPDEAGFIYQVKKKHVEYIDLFHYEKAEAQTSQSRRREETRRR